MAASPKFVFNAAAAEPFRRWQQALGALKAAEVRGESHAEIVRLSAEVIRARNVVTVDRMQAGSRTPDDIFSHLAGEG